MSNHGAEHGGDHSGDHHKEHHDDGHGKKSGGGGLSKELAKHDTIAKAGTEVLSSGWQAVSSTFTVDNLLIRPVEQASGTYLAGSAAEFTKGTVELIPKMFQQDGDGGGDHGHDHGGHDHHGGH